MAFPWTKQQYYRRQSNSGNTPVITDIQKHTRHSEYEFQVFRNAHGRIQSDPRISDKTEQLRKQDHGREQEPPKGRQCNQQKFFKFQYITVFILIERYSNNSS